EGGARARPTRGVAVVAAEVQGGVVAVGGTTGDDQITLSPADGGTVRVVLNGVDLGTFLPIVAGGGQGSVVVYGQAGNDQITLAPAVDGSGFALAALLCG